MRSELPARVAAAAVVAFGLMLRVHRVRQHIRLFRSGDGRAVVAAPVGGLLNLAPALLAALHDMPSYCAISSRCSCLPSARPFSCAFRVRTQYAAVVAPMPVAATIRFLERAPEAKAARAWSS